jgi:tetratricopeptide (TPR) repeat protein
MKWQSGPVFAALFRRGVGLETPGKPSNRSWQWPEFARRYETVRREVKKRTGSDGPTFPLDEATQMRWIKGETRVQRGYRPVLLALFYGPDRASYDDTELERAWKHDDAIAREQRRRTKAAGSGDASEALQSSVNGTPSEAAVRGLRVNWCGASPSLPTDRLAAPEELIDTIRGMLGDSDEPACVLRGQPGVGKSTVAALIAPVIAPNAECPLYWVKFHPDGSHEDETTPAAALHALAMTLGKNLPPDASAKALAEEIRSVLWGKPYAVVCDNVKDESELNDCNLRSRYGIVLATSLSPAWEHVAQIEIDIWHRERCREYIRLRLPEKTAVQNADVALDALATTVGRLPLGLAQSTAYIRCTGVSLENYIARFEASAARLLGARKLPDEGRGPGYKTITSTCYMLFDLIASEATAKDIDVAALRLLCVMGILNIAGASRAFLLKIFSRLFRSEHEDLLDRAIMRLRDFSLISVAQDGLEIAFHQMTHVAARCWIEETYAKRSATPMKHINSCFGCVKQVLQAELRAEPGLQTQMIASHAVGLLSLKDVAETQCDGVERSELLEALAAALAEAFRWPGLHAAIACVCELAEKEPNPKLRLFCNGVRLSIRSGSALGEPDLAESEEGLVQILDSYPGLCSGLRDWRRVAYFWRSLCGTRFDLGDLEGSLVAGDASLRILAEVQDHSSIDVIRGHGARGRTLDALGRSEQGVEEYEKALDALKTEPNRSFLLDRDEVELRYCMADVLLRLDRVAEAAAHLEWARRRAEELGYPRIDQGSIKNSLGQALMFQGAAEATKWLRQGRYAVGRAYGHTHPAYARQLLDIAALLTFRAVLAHPELKPTERQLRAARRLACHALSISEAVEGARRYLFASLMSLSTCHIQARNYQKAWERLAQARTVLGEIADKDAVRVADIRRPLLLRAEAATLAGLGDHIAAEQRLDQLRELRSRELLANRCERARDRCVEAQVLFSAGRMSAGDTSRMLREAADEVQSMYGDGSPVAQLAHKLAERIRTGGDAERNHMRLLV